MRNNKFEFHSFMCINCGNEAYRLPRQASYKYKHNHRKKLYCPYCKLEINCIECQNDFELLNFRLDFQNGKYKDELIKSLEFLKENNHKEVGNDLVFL